MVNSRTASNDSLNSLAKSSTTSATKMQSRMTNAINNNFEVQDLDDDLKSDVSGSTRAAQSLKQLISRHQDELANLENQRKQELSDCQLAFEAKMQEMLEQQDQEVQKTMEDQERGIEELKSIQEKEIKMEETMHDSEIKMHGIINITPVGIITGLNHAAEVMFGYTPEEVIGKNITMLMPERFAVNHHNYLNNYLTTGVKKVIGIGRRVAGLRKNGVEVPLHLSISEMKDDGEHLFTGIARDLSEEVTPKQI